MNKKIRILFIVTVAALATVLIAPMPVFRPPLSTVVEAKDGSLLGARIADDGQWRFPGDGSIPDKFEKSLLTFEDRYFYYHPGINIISIARAFSLNLKAGEIVSGGSTITMQVARVARGNKQRTYVGKIIEMLSALKLELLRTKKTILQMYADNAPFGGNTVGLGAAAWRYTGKPPDDLSWAEAAVLAILPNSPSLVHPGRNRETLRTKRDMLIKKLYERGYMDSLTMILAIDEPLPGEPMSLPAKASHLTDYYYLNDKGKILKTTIDPVLQSRATEVINSHQRILEGNNIFNSACLIIETETGNVLAYVGNSTSKDSTIHGNSVDLIRALRSTGSIMKPFLYAGMQESGDILPETLIPDIPTRFPGFSPQNFDKTFNGAVPADNALSQSLNIPSVKMLQKYHPEKFLALLRKLGFSSFRNNAGHYGLTLILGGGETSLWELTGVYSSLSRVLNNYKIHKKYFREDYNFPVLLADDIQEEKTQNPDPPLSASSIWLTYEALRNVNRPESESGWQYFSSSRDIAFKTGTSFGFRDAWAVGTTPGYVIGVWAGNADGEGRPGLTGITAAAPILFDLVNLMPVGKWFDNPHEELTMIKVCKNSGYRAGPDCHETEEIQSCVNGLRSEACPYHTIVHLNRSKTLQVNTNCAVAGDIINEAWFILPPAMEYYFRQNHPGYKVLPPVAPGCLSDKSIAVMEFIYPVPGLKIFIPRDQSGKLTRMVTEVAHRNPSKKIFWHLDKTFLGTTSDLHQLEIVAEKGSHVLTVVDEDGNVVECRFEIV